MQNKFNTNTFKKPTMDLVLIFITKSYHKFKDFFKNKFNKEKLF